MQGWAKHRTRVLDVGTLVLAVAAVVWLGYQFWRLTVEPQPLGAIDLRLRFIEVRGWFGGEDVYRHNTNAVYPPASYVLLWFALGWSKFLAARWLWALVTALALLATSKLCVHFGRADSPRERRLLALVPLSSYAFGAAVGNGQLGILTLLAILLVAGLLERNRAPSWKRDALLATIFVMALVKPTIAAPFFLVLALAARSLRPALLVVLLYGALTVAAASFQAHDPLELMRSWQERAAGGSMWGATQGEGSIKRVATAGGARAVRLTHVNVHSLLASLHLYRYMTLGSLASLGLLALWLLRRREASIWVLLAVTGFVSRFYTYHGWYDDVVLLLPAVALFRFAKLGGARDPRLARACGVLFAAMLLSTLAPGGIYSLPLFWSNVYVVVQTGLWLVVMAFFIAFAARLSALEGAAPVAAGAAPR